MMKESEIREVSLIPPGEGLKGMEEPYVNTLVTGRINSTQISWDTFRAVSFGQARPEDIEDFNRLTAARNREVLSWLQEDVWLQAFDTPAAGLRFVYDLDYTLDQAEQKNPEAFRSVWTYPFFNGLASRVHELLQNKGSLYRMSPQVATRIAHETGATVAATAIRCDVPCNLEAYVHEGQLVLPSLGNLRLPKRASHVTVQRTPYGNVGVHNEAAGFQMELPRDLSQATEEWQPVRTLHAEAGGHAITVALDDLHYNRSAFSHHYADRPSDPEAARAWHSRWQEHFQGAWEILYSHVPELALAAAGVLGVIIPHKTQAHGHRMFTVSNAAAYRAVGMSMPDSSVSFAKEILHETSHNILDKLNELVPLPDLLRYNNLLHYSPWRRDPRPLGGHIHGMYAHSALADFTRLLAEHATTEKDRQRLTIDFARWRKKVKVAASILVRDVPVESIEPVSSVFLTGMLQKIIGLHDYVIDERVDDLASDEVTDHFNAWQLANKQLDPADVPKLVEFFLTKGASPEPASGLVVTTDFVPPEDRDSFFAKHRLFDMYQDDPGMFQALVKHPELSAAFRGTVPPDVAFVNGDYKKAVEEYESLIEKHPENPKYWSGFLIALSHCSNHKENRALSVILIRPDLLQPLYAEVTKKLAGQGDRIRPRELVERFAAIISAKNSEGKGNEATDG